LPASPHLAREDEAMLEELLAKLRAAGWRVAIHNDYRQNGVAMTFWLMTHESGIYAKGEATTDIEALRQIKSQAGKKVRLTWAP
jgi:hypothetical protein